jgi:hypothetical protein
MPLVDGAAVCGRVVEFKSFDGGRGGDETKEGWPDGLREETLLLACDENVE